MNVYVLYCAEIGRFQPVLISSERIRSFTIRNFLQVFRSAEIMSFEYDFPPFLFIGGTLELNGKFGYWWLVLEEGKYIVVGDKTGN